jgi:hypothetical protein
LVLHSGDWLQVLQSLSPLCLSFAQAAQAKKTPPLKLVFLLQADARVKQKGQNDKRRTACSDQ